MKSKPFNYFLKNSDCYVDRVLTTNNYKEALDCLENYIPKGIITRDISRGNLSVYKISEGVEVHFKMNKMSRSINIYFMVPNNDMSFDLMPNTVIERVKDIEVIRD